VRRTTCTPPRNSLISLTLRKIPNFCIGNLICAQYKFMDGHHLNLEAWFKDVLNYRVNNDIADRIKKKGNTHDVLPLKQNWLYA